MTDVQFAYAVLATTVVVGALLGYEIGRILERRHTRAVLRSFVDGIPGEQR